jgi:hypothetical protein
MEMMKFAVFCALFVTVTGAGQCYDKDSVMHTFSYTISGKKVDLIPVVPAEEKAFQKKSVRTCGDAQACYKYTVNGTATVVVVDAKGVPTKNEKGEVVTTDGTMGFTAQACLEEASATSSEVVAAICKGWQTSLTEEFKKQPSMKDIVSNIKTKCGTPKKCNGDECVAKADRSSATTIGLSFLLLFLPYLLD